MVFHSYRGNHNSFIESIDLLVKSKTSEHSLSAIVRAFKYRNYRLFFGGQSISLIGTWMQQIAMGWLVYRLTDSSLYLGIISFTSQIPSFFITPLAGVIADRWNRRTMLIILQCLFAIQSSTLAVLTMTHAILPWHLIVLSVFLGMISAVEMPVRHSFLADIIIHKRDFSNAIAMNSVMFNSARLIGPSIAGFIIARFGEGICFLINSISYISILASLLFIQLNQKKHHTKHQAVLKNLKEGLVYAYTIVPIRYLLIHLSLMSMWGFSYATFMPALARDVLHGNSHTLGFLMGSVGVGALLAAFYLATRRGIRGMLEKIIVCTFGMVGCLLVLSLSKIFLVSCAILCLCGFCMILFLGCSNTILQTVVAEDKRGRIMSLYTLSLLGTTPIGALILGGVSKVVSIPIVIALSAVLCLISASFFVLKKTVILKQLEPALTDSDFLQRQTGGQRSGVLQQPEVD
ncbi:MAG: MFS transporter [Chitinivibrionales bacterium]|nr:MFS transporter [Chitinivibrionales bacterium]